MCILTVVCELPLDPLKEEEEEVEEERDVFHYNAANRMIATATPIHANEVSVSYMFGHVHQSP